MNWILPSILIALVVLGGFYFLNSQNQNTSHTFYVEQGEPTITVSGSAERTVDPDQVVLYLRIETLDDSASISQSQNAQISDQAKAELFKKGIKEDDLKTTYYTVGLEKEWTSDGYNILGYKTTHKVTVTTSDLENAGEFLDAAVNAGATVDSISFILSDEETEKIKSELLSEAVLDAKEKASKIANAAGSSIGKLVSAQYSTSSGYYSPIYYDSFAMETLLEEDVGTSVSAGQLDISLSVSTSFAIN